MSERSPCWSERNTLPRRRGSMRELSRRTLLALWIGSIAVVGSCAEPSVETSPVAVVELLPATTSVEAGATIALSARVLDANGGPVTVRALNWSSSNTSIATVSSTGVVTTRAPGDVRIAASAFGKSATATISVTARSVASVVVTPATVSMRVGVSAPLQVQTLDVDGVPLLGRAVSWASGNGAVATVNTAGVVTGVSPGAATITATSGGRAGQVAVTVTLPPVQSVSVTPTRDTIGVGVERVLTVVLRDALGAAVTGRAVAWNSSNVGIASVSSVGVVTGVSAGTTTITASSEGRAGVATLVVLARLASTVTLTPASGTLIVGGSQQLIAQITDDQGNLLTGRPIQFSSDATSIASVSGSGLVTALAPGVARISASSEGKSSSAVLQVIPVPVANVTVSPTVVAMLPGATQQLTAVARSTSGTVLNGRTVTWTSGAPSIVNVSSAGLLTAVDPGVALVLASVDGVTGSATITVALPPVSSMTLTPATAEISPFGFVQLVAVPRDANGAALAGRSVTWSSQDESIAFVSSSGQVIGFKSGTVRITATSEGVSASTVVTVR
ncbi:MAG TPA: Ig-like domain-containing protein [Gemmatimonas sp.]|nr:Ig-like domain-containing protein [Gemmatimonas sp.]